MKADVETYHDVTSYSAPPNIGIFCSPRYPWVIVRLGGGGGGGKLTYLNVRVGRKDYTHKKAIYPKNHWIISVPQNTSLVYHTFMWIKLAIWVIIELNKSECAIDKISVVQQCQPPKWISSRLRVIEKCPQKKITHQNFPSPPPPPSPAKTGEWCRIWISLSRLKYRT